MSDEFYSAGWISGLLPCTSPTCDLSTSPLDLYFVLVPSLSSTIFPLISNFFLIIINSSSIARSRAASSTFQLPPLPSPPLPALGITGARIDGPDPPTATHAHAPSTTGSGAISAGAAILRRRGLRTASAQSLLTTAKAGEPGGGRPRGEMGLGLTGFGLGGTSPSPTAALPLPGAVAVRGMAGGRGVPGSHPLGPLLQPLEIVANGAGPMGSAHGMRGAPKAGTSGGGLSRRPPGPSWGAPPGVGRGRGGVNGSGGEGIGIGPSLGVTALGLGVEGGARKAIAMVDNRGALVGDERGGAGPGVDRAHAPPAPMRAHSMSALGAGGHLALGPVSSNRYAMAASDELGDQFEVFRMGRL